MAHHVQYRVYLCDKTKKYRVAIFDLNGKPVDHFGSPYENKVDAVKCANMLNKTFSIVSF